ncbi:YihY/virulence factor BrkB family protein [Ideonella sp. BN130291]|uniref:YihY/virulence factor BrkB family protein n=1 Tax=Ideonella sp. BN130291 TaxID=3112940 RepID=UPI002E25FE98|nr:YihY/virulence factor BrkB family protein [Ideonella sp. BN130291]
MDWRRYLGVVKQAGNGWMDDRAASMGAALSYYTVFSVAPLLLILISVAGLVFGRDAVQGAVVQQIGGLVGDAAAKTIQEVLKSVSEPKEGVIGTVVGLVLLLVGATTVFAELQDDLNRIWKAEPREIPSGIWGWLRARVLSIGMILAIGFLMLVSLAASAAIAALGDWSTSWLSDWEWLMSAVNFIFSYGMVTALFALIYRFMPQVHIRWHDVWIGAAVTAALFTIGKYLIGLYIGKSAVASGFGAAGSLAVLLVWVYYSAQVFLLGAEFTAVYAHAYGSRQGKAATGQGVPGTPAAQQDGKPLPADAKPQPQPQANPGFMPTPALARSAQKAPARPRKPEGRFFGAIHRHPLAGFAGSAAIAAAATLAADLLAQLLRVRIRR